MSIGDIAAQHAAQLLLPPVDHLAELQVDPRHQIDLQREQIMAKDKWKPLAIAGGIVAGILFCASVAKGARKTRSASTE